MHFGVPLTFSTPLRMTATRKSLYRQETESTDASTQPTTRVSRKRKANEADTVAPTKPRGRKRENPTVTPSKSIEIVDLTNDETAIIPEKKAKSAKKQKVTDELASERRARVFRNHPPKTYLDRVARARSQRCDLSLSTCTSLTLGLLSLGCMLLGTALR